MSFHDVMDELGGGFAGFLGHFTDPAYDKGRIFVNGVGEYAKGILGDVSDTTLKLGGLASGTLRGISGDFAGILTWPLIIIAGSVGIYIIYEMAKN
jgi:hypothetical protein